jgi:hypothetical protein
MYIYAAFNACITHTHTSHRIFHHVEVKSNIFFPAFSKQLIIFGHMFKCISHTHIYLCVCVCVSICAAIKATTTTTTRALISYAAHTSTHTTTPTLLIFILLHLIILFVSYSNFWFLNFFEF